MTGPKPPRLAERILRLLLPSTHRDDVAEDLASSFQDQVREKGAGWRARIWYWAQLLSPDTFRLAFLLRRRVRREATSAGKDHKRGPTGRGSAPAAAFQDFRYALRALRHHRGYALLVVLTLGLGIGANAALFSIVDGVVLKPLPFPDSHRLIQISEVDPEQGEWGFSPPNFVDLRNQATVLEDVASYISTSLTLTGGPTPEQVSVYRVSSGFFSLLQRPPVLGRSFLPQEELAGEEPVVVLSHGAWERRFASDPEVLGTSVIFDGTPHTVVGVAAPGLHWGAREPEAWVPIGFSERDLALRGRHFLRVLARVREGTEVGEAQTAINDLWTRLGEDFPETNSGWRTEATPLLKSVIGSAHKPLLLLLGSSGLVLLIACVNVANLTLAKAEGRSREFAIRSAIGSSRTRILRQQLIEHLLLGLGGGGFGLALAYITIGRALPLFGSQLPRVGNIAVDGRVLFFTLAASLAVGLLTALAPMLRDAARDLPGTLGESGARSGMGVTRKRLRGTSVVAEVALSLILVAGTALLLNSFLQLNRVDFGFQPQGLLTGEISLPEDRFQTPRERSDFFLTLTQALESRTEVLSAGAIVALPMTFAYSHDFSGVGERENEDWDVQDRLVTPGYLRTMGIPVLAGRGLEPTDNADAPFVALLNETLADQVFPGESAVGQRIKLKGFPDEESWEVVGVVGDTHMFGPRSDPPPALYRPHSQFRPASFMALVVRTAGAPGGAAGTVREVAAELDPNLPVTRITTMEDILSESMATDRALLLLVGLFGALAVLLGALGVFGVMSYTVSMRTREMGVRMAVGGSPSTVLKMVIRQGMFLVGLGIFLGLVGAVAGGQLLSGILFGVSPRDPVTLTAVASLIFLVSLTACLIPARRAASVDPALSLREE